MYRKIYRQGGGPLAPLQVQELSGLDPYAFMRRTIDDTIRKHSLSRQGSGSGAHRVMERPQLVASQAVAPTGLRSIREGVGDQTIDSSPTENFTSPEQRLITQIQPEEWLYKGDESSRLKGRQYIQDLSLKEALELDKTKYAYDPNLSTPKPTNKLDEVLDRGLYYGKGGVSMLGVDVGPIGGGTPGQRKVYETVMSVPGAERVGKILGRVLPGVGTGLGAIDFAQRLHNKDWGGAVLSLASMAPGINIPATLTQIATDYFGWTGGEGKALRNQLEAQNFQQGLEGIGISTGDTFDKYLPESPITPTTPAIPEEPIYINPVTGNPIKLLTEDNVRQSWEEWLKRGNQFLPQSSIIPALPESPITPTTPAIPEVQVSIEPFYTNYGSLR